MLRRLKVYLHNQHIANLQQDEQGYTFTYLAGYQGIPISLSLPVQQSPFFSETLFPYFASLAPEGWLNQQFSLLQQVDEKDLFGLLAQNGENLIGAVTLVREDL